MSDNLYQDVLTDVRKLSEAQLRTLNQVIVDILKTKKIIAARQFNVGDKVTWIGREGKQNGTIRSLGRINHVVLADTGINWKVTATLLKHI